METGLRVARRRSCLSSVQLVLLTFAIFLQGTIGQLVDVEPSQATLTEGDSINLLCRSGNPLNYCRFVIPGESNVVVLSEQWPPKVPGYKYHGQGTHAGQCGVTIERVSARNHGKVKCYLGFQGDELSGTIDLVVALPPRRPELEVVLAGQQTQRSRGNFYEANDDIEARCISRDGRPPANITWFLNDEPITEGLAAPVVVESTGNGNTTNLYSVYQILRRRIAPTDDGKFLVCRTSHIADRGQDNSVKQQMIVRFAPMPQDPVTVYGVTLSRTALINVTVQANPRPRVEWTANGVVVTQGQQNGRYEAYEPTDFGNGLYNVVLSIDSITLEDTTKDYYLRASNELGQTEYIVRISSSTTPAASGLDTGAIIGIVVAVAVLLIVVILIIFARATGRWCFEAKSSQPATSETAQQSSDHQESRALLNSPTAATTPSIIGTVPATPISTDNYNSSNSNTQFASENIHAMEGPSNYHSAGNRGEMLCNPSTITLSGNEHFIHYMPQVTMSGPASTADSSFLESDGDGSFSTNNNNNYNTSNSNNERRTNDLGIPMFGMFRWNRAQQKELLQREAQLRVNSRSFSTDIY